ncbi:MAG: SDR family NAD(P)-dependent oxidoreductase [Janthinobacterium lividum]
MNAPVKRVAIVTGVGMGIGGIGRGIAEAFAAQGTSLMLADVDPRVAEVASDLRGRHGAAEIDSFAADLSTEAGVKGLVAATLERFGQIDVLVNNAGSGVIRAFLEHDEESFTATLARNLWTAIWCCHKVLPHMVERNHGRIINIGADSLRTGIPMHAGYNAAKGGVVGMMVGLAKEFAQYDITINTVSPCVVDTERHRARLKSDPAVSAAFLAVVPKGRGAGIHEIADTVTFLARPECAFITGQDISVNGGSAMP